MLHFLITEKRRGEAEWWEGCGWPQLEGHIRTKTAGYEDISYPFQYVTTTFNAISQNNNMLKYNAKLSDTDSNWGTGLNSFICSST